MAKIRELFVKEIDRKINGVIKADSQEEKEFKEEIDEYVITSELTGRFNELLDRYIGSLSTQTEDVGVWISGFFGSGKSHLLKMLGILLGNKTIEGKLPLEYFKENDTVGSNNTHTFSSLLGETAPNPNPFFTENVGKATIDWSWREVELRDLYKSKTFEIENAIEKLKAKMMEDMKKNKQ